MRHHRIVLLAAIGLSAVPAAAPARPFIDPRAERNEAIDRAAATEPRDPACHDRRLAAAGGAMPRSPHTLVVRWMGYGNFELVHNGHILLLDAYYDRGRLYPPLGVILASVGRTCHEQGVALPQLSRIAFLSDEVRVELGGAGGQQPAKVYRFPIEGVLGAPRPEQTPLQLVAARLARSGD